MMGVSKFGSSSKLRTLIFKQPLVNRQATRSRRSEAGIPPSKQVDAKALGTRRPRLEKNVSKNASGWSCRSIYVSEFISGLKISNFFWKETTAELLSNQFPFIFEAAKQKLYNQKSLNHLPSKIMCRMGLPVYPSTRNPSTWDPSFFIVSELQCVSRSRKDWKKNTGQLGSVHYWFVQIFVEVSGTDQFLTKIYQLRLRPFEKMRSKKTRFFHKIIMKHEVLSLHLRTSFTTARNSWSFLMIRCTYADVGE